MGRLIPSLVLLCCSTMALAQGVPQSIPQEHMDSIREYHTKQILGSSQNLTNLQPDVQLFRRLFDRPSNVVDQQRHIALDPIPMAQIFKGADLNVGQLVNVAAAASGYTAVFHPQVDQSQRVKINSRPNSLSDIAEYLTRVTDAQYSIYQESREMVAMPKGTVK